MKRFLSILFLCCFFNVNAQITESPTVQSQNTSNAVISRVELTAQHTIVYLSYVKTQSNAYQAWVSISSSTRIVDPVSNYYYPIRALGDNLALDQRYSTTGKKGTVYGMKMLFPPLPPGLTKFDIIESDGFVWKGVSISNPDRSETTNWNELTLKADWEKNGIGSLEGIYEGTNSSERDYKYRLAVRKKGDAFQAIYLSGNSNGKWKVGDVKANILRTASPNLFKAEYFMADKSKNDNAYIAFEPALMKIIWSDGQGESLFLKLYPTSVNEVNDSGKLAGSGTGFAITSSGYIATNYHVTQGAKSLKIRGVKGNFYKSYRARVVVEDKNNDLAIIKIDDEDFTTLGTVPYLVDGSIKDIGSSVYALGYPLRSTMGDEIKLTNGIVSAKTGFQGDITAYQISVPIQPGNSGGPLFDSRGNVLGIINAKHLGTENVSYAIKATYLKNLINELPETPRSVAADLQGRSMSEQVKYLKEFVYIVEVNN